MDIKRIKFNLNQRVLHNGTEYIFTGCTLRLNNEGYYYEAELRDTRARSSILICRLNEIEEKKDE